MIALQILSSDRWQAALLYTSFRIAPPLGFHQATLCKSCSALAPPSRSVPSICRHFLSNASLAV